MRHPFQCLALAATPDAGILVVAAGSSISTFKLNDGALLATWFPSAIATNQNNGVERKATQPISERLQDDTGPPDKRRKLSERGETSDRPAGLKAVDIPKSLAGTVRTSKLAVTNLAITSDTKHVIAVTGSDKCIRVFDMTEDGTLLQRSER